MKNSTHSVARWGTAAIAGTFLLNIAVGAQAQPGGGGGGGGNRMGNMTPEQRQQFMEQMETQRAQARETWQRQSMTSAGLTDEAAQTAVIDYEKSRDDAKAALQEQARALSILITNPATAADAITRELTAFRTAVADYRKQQTAALSDLDTKVKYSTSPRIDALLTLLGILGDETNTLGGIGVLFPDSPYGNNARGGRVGGRGQGAGGQGGRGQGAGGRRGRGGNAAGGNGGGGAAAGDDQE